MKILTELLLKILKRFSSVSIVTILCFVGFIWKVYPHLKGFAKDMLFFALFAITVTSSVSLAGVLTVFVFLIAPPFIALSFNKESLIFAWIAGWFFAVIAILISYYFDLPTGYTIVTFGSLFALVSGVIVSRK